MAQGGWQHGFFPEFKFAEAVTLSDSADISNYQGIVGIQNKGAADGLIAWHAVNGSAQEEIMIPAGQILWFTPRRILSTGTTIVATDLVALRNVAAGS